MIEKNSHPCGLYGKNAPTSTPKTDITLSPLGISLSTGNISNTGTRRLSLNKSRTLSFDNNINSGLPSQNNDDSKKSSLKLSLNGEEENVKAEKLSQTTTSLPNNLTLTKVNSAPTESNLKPPLNGEEENVKAEKLSQTTTSFSKQSYIDKSEFCPYRK